jgi:hypothetical protein
MRPRNHHRIRRVQRNHHLSDVDCINSRLDGFTAFGLVQRDLHLQAGRRQIVRHELAGPQSGAVIDHEGLALSHKLTLGDTNNLFWIGNRMANPLRMTVVLLQD